MEAELFSSSKIKIKWDEISLTGYTSNYKLTELLRKKYKIVAEGTGTLRTSRRQNKIKSEPFVLSKFEVFYLFERNELEFDSIEEEIIGVSNYEEFKNSNVFRVYKDLKQRGFYVTSGFKYGVDFLIYREDPNFIHSEYFLNVYDKKETINVNELIRGERLGVSTKKKFIAAYIGDNEDQIQYLNFEWLNI